MQVAVVGVAAGPIVSCVGTSNPWRCLSEDEARTLEALVDRIIPADQDPGAAWAGVTNFIDRQLVGPYRRLQKTYRQGLTGTNETSAAMFGKRFPALSTEQQDEVLRTLESGQASGESWKPLPATQFFGLLVSHTMQGFCGDPRHGGNRERVSWKGLHLPFPPVRGRKHALYARCPIIVTYNPHDFLVGLPYGVSIPASAMPPQTSSKGTSGQECGKRG